MAYLHSHLETIAIHPTPRLFRPTNILPVIKVTQTMRQHLLVQVRIPHQPRITPRPTRLRAGPRFLPFSLRVPTIYDLQEVYLYLDPRLATDAHPPRPLARLVEAILSRRNSPPSVLFRDISTAHKVLVRALVPELVRV